MSYQLKNSLRRVLIAAPLLAALSGCDVVQQRMGFEDPVVKAARDEAEGKAVGGACRQSGRAIEDCYSIYSWLPKSPIYEGWRDMDAYMRENKLETITPQLPPPPPPETKKKKKKAATAGEAPVSTENGEKTETPDKAAEKH